VGRPIPYLQAILGVTADGKIGPITLRYIKEKMSAKLIVRFIDARLEYLKTRPNYWKFKGGWVKRCSIIKAAALKAFEAQQLASNG
jgi:lysozyme family protein